MSGEGVTILVIGVLLTLTSSVGLIFSQALTRANNEKGPEWFRNLSILGPEQGRRGSPRGAIMVLLLILLAGGIVMILAGIDGVPHTHH